MLKLAKLTDYGIVLLSYMARDPGETARTARELADTSGLPLPTVSKVLKMLSRSGLLLSHRGKHGGYSLAREPHLISVAEMLEALEGKLSLTECASDVSGACEIQPSCPVQSNWQLINRAVFEALGQIRLSDMTPPASGAFSSDVVLGAGLLDVVRRG